MPTVAENSIERFQVQLAGCLTAAEGSTPPAAVVGRDAYGWSPAYQAVIDLRVERDRLAQLLDDIDTAHDQFKPDGVTHHRAVVGYLAFIREAVAHAKDPKQPKPKLLADL